ncbi:MAG TPA: cytochrome c-type biogenesis protein CcmH [Gemmatimonadales bacterium]|jgi:cytochrome c-type biogenesis protein CcmH|nr:cytochrome c-type biogenesis protein CcmH [Gemmatimonadales bacterium]
MLARRAFLKLSAVGGAMILGPSLLRSQQQDSLSGRGETGTLRDPYSVGRPQERVEAADNDEVIKNIEHKLRCSCGCNLDIFTCRTTDFSCTTSPKLHRQVVALHDSGLSPEQVVQRFVDEYGEQALMAPRPEGFNLAGYLVPGAVILVAASLLGAYLLRRRQVSVAEAPGGTVAAPMPAASTPGTPEELARLHRALTEDEEL